MGDGDGAGAALFWQRAEAAAAAHARTLGFADVAVTAPGSDGGLDLSGTQVGGQVKAHRSPVGRPDVQRLVGAAWGCEHRLFYSASGYTPGAAAFADECGVALFTIDASLTVTATNDAAEALCAHAVAAPAAIHATTEPPVARRSPWVAAGMVAAAVVVGSFVAAAGPFAVGVGLEARQRRTTDAGAVGWWFVFVGLGVAGCAWWAGEVARAVLGTDSTAVAAVQVPVAVVLASTGALSARRGLWAKVPLPAQLTS